VIISAAIRTATARQIECAVNDFMVPPLVVRV
jgi:hypothetical protein